ncbi:hypothetical protein [Pseudonocardia sp. ICBG601]|uniref:hypothetical protein n=1 Tax=Pseudonocardia sp. ICBG601 TaxID=2846759 RepID=UPI001CF6545D|nr:hypothetical protein [Pseudonocardia sp. ICBG601]
MPDTNTSPDRAQTELDALRAERVDIQAAIDANPLRSAPDVAQWRARKQISDQRLDEIEIRERDLTEFGTVVLDNPDELTRYLATARPIQRRFTRLIETRRWRRDTNGTGADYDSDVAHRGVIDWWRGLAHFATQLDHDTEASKALLAREADSWLTFRNAVLIADALWTNWDIPAPEAGIDGEWPTWLASGVYRTDRAPTQ